MLSAVVGVNWGDEGKGRMVDLLSQEYDIICRFQGGNNAGHTVINERGKFVLNLLPSGILRESAVNVMGTGMVIDLEHLHGEILHLREQGIAVTPANLKISDKATICLPYHKQQDCLEEARLADKQYGSTRRGIAYVYGDKYLKKGLRIGDLRNFQTLGEKLQNILTYKDMILTAYGAPKADFDELFTWLKTYGSEILPFVVDTTEFLEEAVTANKKILFEAQLGALRDIDYGIYPYTTSSTCLAAYAPIGAGLPGARLDKVIGVVKAYSSCVGEGPFTAELFGEKAEELRAAGGEYGAATGRPRRVGGFDIPASRYGVLVQGATEIALTKLDVLSYLKEIPVCVAYEIDGVRTDRFPSGDDLMKAQPVYEYLPGFMTDISQCKRKEDLPQAALDYITYIEKAIKAPIKYVSVGAEREDYIQMF